MSNRRLGTRGFTLMEAVVAITIFVLGVVGLISLIVVSKTTSEQGRDTVQAANYLQEGAEAARAVRDAAWTNVSTAGNYHLIAQAGQNPPWTLAGGGSETVGKFTRTVQISDVMRTDTNGDGQLSAGDVIAPSGGTLADPDTKKVTVTVSWTRTGGRIVTRTLYLYLTNWQS